MVIYDERARREKRVSQAIARRLSLVVIIYQAWSFSRAAKNFQKIEKKTCILKNTVVLYQRCPGGQRNAPLAQLDKASGYGPEGQEFESLTACQNPEVERLRDFCISKKFVLKI